MPKWLYNELEAGPPVRRVNKIGLDGRLSTHSFIETEVAGLVPVLSQLSALSEPVKMAYFCHPSVQHVYKRKSHGGFCGYTNIQMMVSYIQGARAQGHDRFGKSIPGVLQLQDMIENAWDHGVRKSGRLETGGIKGTRKWIGTPETATLFEHVGIPHHAAMFFHKSGRQAHEQLFDFVENHFSHGCASTDKIRTTHRAPIYLQQPGHSLTIVGLECYKDGTRNLLVFDPGFGPSRDIRRFIGKQKLYKLVSNRDVQFLLRTYRRTSKQLAKYRTFEVLT